MTFPSWAEPDFFTLEQICQRWSDWDCSVADIIQLFKSDKIEVSVDLPLTKTSTGLDISGRFAVLPDDIRENHGDYQVELSTVFESRHSEKNKENLIAHQLRKKQFLFSDSLVITKKERDRFEAGSKQARTTDGSPIEPADTPINSREKNGMQSVMEVLCLMSRVNMKNVFKTAGIIKMEADLAEIKTPSVQTIANYLKSINDRNTN